MKRALLGSILLHALLLGVLVMAFQPPPPSPQALQLFLQSTPQTGGEPAPPAAKHSGLQAAAAPKSSAKAMPAAPANAARPDVLMAKTLAAKPAAAAPLSAPPAVPAPAEAAAAAHGTTAQAAIGAGGQTGEQGSSQAHGRTTEKTGSSKEVRVRLAPKPDYPALSRERDEEGTVWLQVDVDQAGMPARIQLLRSSGFARLDRAARQGVAAWRFDPAMQDGQTQPSRIELPVRFSLKEQ